MFGFSSSPHASIYKSLGILGCGRKSLNIIAHLPNREAIDIGALERALSKSSAKAKIIIASAATVNSGDFDDLVSLAAICRRYNAWLHVDAAFGLFARCSPDYITLTTGIEEADSITVDGHKWLNVPYDCGILFIKQEHKEYLLSAFSSSASYMSNASDEPMNKGVENSRALRALPIWTTLKAYGHLGYQELIERNCKFAQAIAAMINKMDNYILLAPVKLNIVLFKGKNISSPEQNQELLSKINGSGKIFITSTIYEGKPSLRLAVCNWMTDISKDISAVEEALNQGLM